MVEGGAVVADVIVEHEVYDEITGNLNLRTPEDVESFVAKVESAQVRLLSELTLGIHLHTLVCRDRAHYERVAEALDGLGFLYGG